MTGRTPLQVSETLVGVSCTRRRTDEIEVAVGTDESLDADEAWVRRQLGEQGGLAQ